MHVGGKDAAAHRRDLARRRYVVVDLDDAMAMWAQRLQIELRAVGVVEARLEERLVSRLHVHEVEPVVAWAEPVRRALRGLRYGEALCDLRVEVRAAAGDEGEHEHDRHDAS